MDHFSLWRTFYVENLSTEPKIKRFQIGVKDRELLSDVRAFSVDSHGEIYFVGNSNNQSSLYKIVPIAHLNMDVSDQVILSVLGDEDSLITLQKSNVLDFTNPEETTISNGELSTKPFHLKKGFL